MGEWVKMAWQEAYLLNTWGTYCCTPPLRVKPAFASNRPRKLSGDHEPKKALFLPSSAPSACKQGQRSPSSRSRCEASHLTTGPVAALQDRVTAGSLDS
jgi:hypothetical protein